MTPRFRIVEALTPPRFIVQERDRSRRGRSYKVVASYAKRSEAEAYVGREEVNEKAN